MAKFLVDETSLASVADAIREKTAGGATLAFPDGFVAAISSIEADGGACTSGTITPFAKIHEIEHGLGEIPKMFMWFTDFNNTMTGKTCSGSFTDSEQAYNSADLSGYTDCVTRFVFILMEGKIFSLRQGAAVDWGNFCKVSIDDLTYVLSIDETTFTQVNPPSTSVIPYDESGNVTIHWFAFGG